ncbi:MAG: carbohydrate binding family 9 domain-containing protein [Flavisolibacter sp.]|nr:carbohydrate binding family 9 domain-containing protein [Flavisolibacter sp.]
MRPFFVFIILTTLFSFRLSAQPTPKQLAAKRTTASIKIDGKLDEAAWKEAQPATNFVEWRPNFGAVEDHDTRTEVYLLYDNTAIYVGGYCHERNKDSVSKELVGRDVVGVNDYVGVIFDTYLDKINGFGFYVTPLGEQFDAKYSNTAGEDGSWSAVWDSEAQIVQDGWVFEMRIPYSALRFVSKEDQTWGLNITRNRKKTGRQFMWNPVDPKVNGFLNQEGLWTNIEKIDAPLRLSFSPYLSTYLNHYKDNPKPWTSSVNGGMDVKYGISDAFTLDMTLIPDFGQVQSDNRVLNLTPFEIRYQENRPFFTEGTELFSKGNLFYPRRVGKSLPLHYGDVQDLKNSGYTIKENPQESKLINATKISGRTKKGLGVGVFNAITKPMYAEVEDAAKNVSKIKTNSLTNYNIVVLDQTLKNNSAISFINTSTIRNGSDRDANVSAALFDFNNKKNTFNWNGKFALSQIFEDPKNATGYSHNIGFGKTGGRWNFQLSEEIADDKYSQNDLGYATNNNFIDHYFWTGYRWLKPKKWYNRIQVNYNAYYSRLYNEVPDQKINSKFQTFNTNVNANVQFKNLWWAGLFVGYVSEGNDIYEPRKQGWVFKSPERKQFNGWFETNFTKRYYMSFNYFIGLRSLFNSPNHQLNLFHRYRFNDKLAMEQSLTYNPATNDAGFYGFSYQKDGSGSYLLDNNNEKIFRSVFFSRRDRKTIENVFSIKYNFNNKSGLTFRARHYWSRVRVKELYDLQADGTLVPAVPDEPIEHKNTNFFNIDALYTWQFAPGSFLNIAWKDEGQFYDGDPRLTYFKNFDRTLAEHQVNNLSVKVIYYLDYLNFRKWSKKK